MRAITVTLITTRPGEVNAYVFNCYASNEHEALGAAVADAKRVYPGCTIAGHRTSDVTDWAREFVRQHPV